MMESSDSALHNNPPMAVVRQLVPPQYPLIVNISPNVSAHNITAAPLQEGLPIPTAQGEYTSSTPTSSLLETLHDVSLAESPEEVEQHLQQVINLIENGADLELTDVLYGRTALHLAAGYGFTEIVELLIQRKANTEARDNGGRTPLDWARENQHEAVIALLESRRLPDSPIPFNKAAAQGNLTEVERLLEEGARVDRGTLTALHYAAFYNHAPIVQLLLAKGADLKAKDKEGRTPLDLALQQGHEEVVKLLIEQERDIHMVVRYGDIEVVRRLITKGADLNARDKEGYTPLDRAMDRGDIKIIRLLIAKGAEVNAPGINGSTPLHRAAERGNIEVVDVLIDLKANIHATNNSDATPLHIAAGRGHREVVALLIEEGADIHATNTYGWSPLHEAARNGHREIVELLIKEGVNIHATISSGTTPLYMAARNGHREVVELLIQKGANIHATDNNGWSPLHWAARYGHSEVVELLIQQGADIYARDNNGHIPLYYAAENKHTEVIELLKAKVAK